MTKIVYNNFYELEVILRNNLTEAKNHRLLAIQVPELFFVKYKIKEFQIAKLKITHHDFLTSPATKDATKFFLNELYNTKDLTERDKQAEKLIPFILKMFPTQTLEIIAKAFILDALTERLDTKMAQDIIKDVMTKRNMSEDEYKQYYLKTSSQQDREQQISLVQDIGLELCKVVKIPLISQVLKAMRLPAKMAKLTEIHNFLEGGFNTFKNTHQPENFVKSIYQREIKILKEYYGVN